MKAKIYASDEGWGHLVRQRAIYEMIAEKRPDIEFDLQTSRSVNIARNIFPEKVKIIDRFNNISYSREKGGNPDLAKIREFFSSYERRSDLYIQKEIDECDYDFIISDFVYEAFSVACEKGIPAFGVAHFSWDWFFSRMYPVPLESKILNRMSCSAKSADKLFFSHFTPDAILDYYQERSTRVPLIVRKNKKRDLRFDDKKRDFLIMIIDNGRGPLSQIFIDALRKCDALKNNGNIKFLVSKNLINDRLDNIIQIPNDELLSDYIHCVDLVLARGGFNTISECISCRIPILLLGESQNPEMQHNLLCLKHAGLGTFVSEYSIKKNFISAIKQVIDSEYTQLKKNMDSHQIPCNGAEVVAEQILNLI